MNQLTSKQYISIVVFIFFTSKLVTMPTLVFSAAGKDAIVSVLLNCLIEFVTILLITAVIKKYPNKTLLEVLKPKIGILSYLIYAVLILFLIARIVYCFQELYSFFLETLYDELNPYIFIGTALIVCVFFAFKKVNVIGRTCEILIWLILIGTILSLLSNLEYTDFTQNMPYFEDGLTPTVLGCKDSLFLFGTSAALLLLLGKVKISPHFMQNTSIVSAICVTFCTLSCLIFYATFGQAMQYVLFSLSEYSQFDPYILELQRLIWLSAVIDISKLFCSTCCLMYFLRIAMFETFQFKSRFVPIVSIATIIAVLGIITRFDVIIWFEFAKGFLSIFTIVMIVLCQIICLILSCWREKCQSHQ